MSSIDKHFLITVPLWLFKLLPIFLCATSFLFHDHFINFNHILLLILSSGHCIFLLRVVLEKLTNDT